MLFDDLKKANMMALKEKDLVVKGILPIVINKCMLLKVDLKVKGIEITDADVLNIIQKTIKELDEEIKAFQEANREEKVSELKKQREYLQTYLPKQLTEDEIRELIMKLEDKTIPSVMKFFKTNYNGAVDMKLVSVIAKEF